MARVRQPAFNPNEVSFEEGLARIREAAKRSKLSVDRKVVSSRDRAAQQAQRLLEVSNVPGGFRKWQLPVHLAEPAQLFVTVAEPDIEVPEHSHDEGDGIRFIASGSIIYNGKELTTGDWMFIPAGASYSFRVGPMGAVMCYCYCCCCAGRRDLFSDQGDPTPVLGP
jgi:quercetin dioxygenase-like cupin family protein